MQVRIFMANEANYSVLMLNEAAIAWMSKRQNVAALSSAEAEFMTMSSLVQEVI